MSLYFWDDPETVAELSDLPDPIGIPIGSLFRWYNNFRIREDAKQMDDDLYRNTGQSWKKSKYPFYSYNYQSNAGKYGSSMLGSFAASSSVINMASRRLLKW